MRLALVGASGHGKVVAEIAEDLGHEVVFFDDAWPNKKTIGTWNIQGDTRALFNLKEKFEGCFISIGNNQIRNEKQEALIRQGFVIVNLIHPRAIVSRYSEIGAGTVVMAGAIINAFSSIGNGCIINTGATIDHDCILKDFVHVAPGSHLAGDVNVSNCSSVGIGVSVKQGIHIGANTIIGAGAVVISNLPSEAVAVGIPAKLINK